MLEPGKLAYGIKEVGRAINAGQSTVYEYIKIGKIRAVKHGRRTLVLAADLERYLGGLPAIAADVASATTDVEPQERKRAARASTALHPFTDPFESQRGARKPHDERATHVNTGKSK